jgi:hypothetical protein
MSYCQEIRRERSREWLLLGLIGAVAAIDVAITVVSLLP